MVGIGSWVGGCLTPGKGSALQMATLPAMCGSTSKTHADSWVSTGRSLQDKWLYT